MALTSRPLRPSARKGSFAAGRPEASVVMVCSLGGCGLRRLAGRPEGGDLRQGLGATRLCDVVGEPLDHGDELGARLTAIAAGVPIPEVLMLGARRLERCRHRAELCLAA